MSAEDHSLFVEEITLPCLKNLKAMKAYIAAKPSPILVTKVMKMTYLLSLKDRIILATRFLEER